MCLDYEETSDEGDDSFFIFFLESELDEIIDDRNMRKGKLF